MKKITLTLFCFGLLLLFAAPGQAQAVSDQGICNSALVGGSLGSATGCGALITVTAVDGNGKAIAFTMTIPNNTGTQAGNGNPYDGTEDLLVGVLNNSNGYLNSLPLTSSDTRFGGIFGFDGDGPCNFTGGAADCFNDSSEDPYDYEGPGNTLNRDPGTACGLGTCFTSGTVNFTPPLAPASSCVEACLDSTWFALEGTPNSLTLTSEMQTLTFTGGQNNQTQTASFGTGGSAHTIGHTIPVVKNTFTINETANYVDTEFSNGGISGPGIVDGICEFPAPNPVPDNDLDCREAAGGFVFQTLNNGDQVVPHALPYHNGQAVWYRASTTAVAGTDYTGPVADVWTFATNPSLTSSPVNTEYTPGWNNQNGRVYDRPGTNANNPFVADITDYFDGEPGAGGHQPTLNDWVLAAVPNPEPGAADTEITLLPLPKPSPATYIKGLAMPVSFLLVNAKTFAPDPTALISPNMVNISTQDSSGNTIPVQFQKGFPTSFTCLVLGKAGCVGIYSVVISSTPYQKGQVYNMQIGSDLFTTPVNLPFVVK